ncbi:hypothetical protein [Catellatospora chokoriensis]|uniref:Uncharacterized protein n=1 Tax=Catellatospora chokoriensis TaxID=310353 RepID=A0A8J3K0E4_9ACTN|nr:hypothetical protein [Catellatospora chokoriensis]GIF90646.1 hypothetical protein Cch02nite_40900 [Catellatospora chokoriensis]
MLAAGLLANPPAEARGRYIHISMETWANEFSDTDPPGTPPDLVRVGKSGSNTDTRDAYAVAGFGHHRPMVIEPPRADSDGPKRTRNQSLLHEHAGVRQLTVDDHRFTVPAGGGRMAATFRLQLFTAPGLRPIAVVTQKLGEGAGPINHAEHYVEAIWRQRLPDDPQPPIMIGHLLMGSPDEDGVRDLGFSPITFRVADATEHQVQRGPIWGGTMSPQDLERLVGQPVDPGRGGGFTPLEAPLDPQQRLRVQLVALLPRSDISSPACMSAPTPWWRRLGRQIAPIRSARNCCWYHGGDWHRVTQAAIDVLHHAELAGGDADEADLAAAGLAEDLDLSMWEREALKSLLLDPIAPDRDVEGVGYINGRHRAQAMLDTGVRRTVVAVWEFPPNAR